MFVFALCLRSKLITRRVLNLRYSQMLKCSRMTGFQLHSEVLQKLLGCSPEKGVQIVRENPAVRNINLTTLERTIKVLQKAGIENNAILEDPSVMTISPRTADHHAMLLQEGGFNNVTPRLLLGYFNVIKKRISLLKAHRVIPRQVKVLDSFLSHLETPPSHVAPVCLPTKQDAATFFEVYDAVVQHYLMWRLEMEPAEWNRIRTLYKRYLHKSLRHYRRNLELLEDDIGFTKDKIRRNGYLLFSYPENTLDTLRRVDSLGGKDIRSVFRMYPKILMMKTDTIIQNYNLMKKFGISDHSMRQCLNVFTLGSESVRKRLEVIHEVPEFKVLTHNPRILKLVYSHNKAISRLNYLQQQRVSCISLHLLSATRAKFIRYASMGEDRFTCRDIVLYLESVLGLSYSEVYARMARHLHWQNVSSVSVSSTLEMLFELGYSKETIGRNIQLLVYPRATVERELELLSEREETKSAQEMYGIPVLSPDVTLALCIYYIERKHHFTGNGVWGLADKAEPATFNVPAIPYDEPSRPCFVQRSATI